MIPMSTTAELETFLHSLTADRHHAEVHEAVSSDGPYPFTQEGHPGYRVAWCLQCPGPYIIALGRDASDCGMHGTELPPRPKELEPA